MEPIMDGFAYVISRFPLLSETFILREILELKRQGWCFDTHAMQSVGGRVRHPEAALLAPSVRILRPFSPELMRANIRLMQADPSQYARLLSTVVHGNCRSADFLAKGLVVLPWAVQIAERMRARGVRHIHAHYGTHPALIAMMTAQLLGISFSFTVHAHDLFANTTMLAEKVRAARFVVTISEFNRQALCRLAGPSLTDRIEVIRCGLDLEAYPFRREAPAFSERRILAVGSLQGYKGHDRLIRACALLRQESPLRPFRCSIVGEGPLRATLQQLINSLGLAGHVRLLGGQEQQTVRRLMEQADTLVLPSVVAPDGQMEGLPVTLMEAMAIGTPVIASALSGIPELVRDGETGVLVPPDAPSAIRDALLRCWDQPAETAERARRARTLVVAQHDLGKNVTALADLFSQALSGTAAPATQCGARTSGEQ
jgi:glycosyltransferase involved in cell wall biosynthesis